MSARTNGQLADVNVFLALLWPRHVHHAAAQAWFAAEGHRNWATNSITQIGVLRLLTNPAITGGAVNATTALETLAEATRHANHQFWPLDRPMPSLLDGATTGLTGYRQWTDLLLLRHAAERKGKMVSFDKRLRELTPKKSRGNLLILEG